MLRHGCILENSEFAFASRTALHAKAYAIVPCMVVAEIVLGEDFEDGLETGAAAAALSRFHTTRNPAVRHTTRTQRQMIAH